MSALRPSCALVGLALVAGCPAPTEKGAGKPAAAEAPLVVFTADSDATKNPGLSQVAAALNSALKASFADGKARVSPVNIADARAVVEECNSAGATNDRCWNALASLNHAREVLVPDLSSERGGQVAVAITRFDATAQRVVKSARGTWKSASEACAGVGKLVGDVAGGPGTLD